MIQKSSKTKKKQNVVKRQPDFILRDLITALAVCHNVTPIINEDGTKEYQASSPDEVALVKLAESLDMILYSRYF